MQTDGQANLADTDVTSSVPEGGGTGPAAGDDLVDVVALRAEVLKWQERVPKLAAALRERTEELAAARDALRHAQGTSTGVEQRGEDGDARVRARDELIEVLQQKISEVNARHKTAASELHVTQLDLEHAREEAHRWQDKWHEVTSSLDTSVADATRSNSELARAKEVWEEKERELTVAHENALARIQRDVESLRVRNGNLQETIDFANRQIATLGEDMSALMEQITVGDKALLEARADLERVKEVDAELGQRIETLELLLSERQQELDDSQSVQSGLREESVAKDQQIRSLEQKLADQKNEHEETLAGQTREISQLREEHQREQSALQDQLEEGRQLTEDKQVQIGHLRENEQNLTRDIQASKAQIENLEANLAQVEAQSDAELQKALAASERAMQQVQSLQGALQVAQEQCVELEQTTDTRQQALQNEISRLSECVEQAQASQAQFEQERRQLAEKAVKLEEENHRLNVNLKERSALVGELEEERNAHQESATVSSAEHEQLHLELKESLHKLDTFQEHARTLEGRLVTQQSLMSELELELSEAQEASAAALKSAEQAYREEIEEHRKSKTRLGTLTDQCEELSRRNQELGEQLLPRDRGDSGADDLTSLKGIGEKLAEQLAGLGVTSLIQLAELDVAKLDDPAHPLHGLKNRMIRDDWIEQAQTLLNNRH